MYIQSSKILPLFLRYGVSIFLLLVLLGIIINEDFRTIKQPYDHDEKFYYQKHAQNFTIQHFQDVYNANRESNPISFLALYKILGISSTPYIARLFNLILIIICSYLLYRITNNKISFFYPIIPIFLDSMWLTLEIVEIFFVLLAMIYKDRSGILIGIATVFRPFALLYTFTLSKPQVLYVLLVGILFSVLLLALGLFFPYLHEVTVYSGDGFPGLDMLVIVILFMFLIIGLNKQILLYIVVSVLPLFVKTYPHYFLPLFTWLFLGFLWNMNDDMKDLHENSVK